MISIRNHHGSIQQQRLEGKLHRQKLGLATEHHIETGSHELRQQRGAGILMHIHIDLRVCLVKAWQQL